MNSIEKRCMKSFTIASIIIMLLCSCLPVQACSSFAYYGDQTLYGMNWDYYTGYDATIFIKTIDDIKVFNVFNKDGYDFTGMNTNGLFAAQQMVTPEEKPGFIQNQANAELETISMKDLYSTSLYKFSEIGEINEFMQNKRVTHTMVEHHTMFADKSGSAQVVEVGKDKNMITSIQDKFIIMTNFMNYYYADTDYKKIVARGSDRYIAGYDFMLENIDTFDFAKGMEMLKAMKCEETGFYTLCSFLYKPETDCVYVAVNRDFDKIWKISIWEETAETFKGFESPLKIKIDGSIKLSDLKELTYYNPQTLEAFENKFIVKPASNIKLNETSKMYHRQAGQKKIFYIAIGIFLIGLPCIILFSKRRRAKTG